MKTKEELKPDKHYLKLFVDEYDEVEIKNAFRGGTSLTPPPPGLFDNATSVVINSKLRSCSSLTLKEGSPIYREFLNRSRHNDKKR